MSLIPWKNKKEIESKEGVSPVMQLRGEVDRLLERFFANPWSLFDRDTGIWPSSNWMPPVEIAENEHEVTVKLEVPGVELKDIDISLTGHTLTVKGEKKEETEEKDKSTYRMERRFGSFQRSLELPESVDENQIAADFKNGVLTVRAKKNPTTPTRKITIS